MVEKKTKKETNVEFTMLTRSTRKRQTEGMMRNVESEMDLNMNKDVSGAPVTATEPEGALLYHDKGTPPKKGGGSSFTVTKIPSSLEPKGQRPLSFPHSP